MELIRTYSEPMPVAGSMLCKVGGMEFVKILSFNFHFDAITLLVLMCNRIFTYLGKYLQGFESLIH